MVDGRPTLIAGRPLSGNSSGVVLTRPAATGTAGRHARRGLARAARRAARRRAGRRAAGPVHRPADPAGRGRRRPALRRRPLDPAGRRRSPAEAAELAGAFNQLAAALQISEGRERDFLLSVSHELRTPLSTIRGYAEALADGVVERGRRPEGRRDHAGRGGPAGPADRRPAGARPGWRPPTCRWTSSPVDLVELVRSAAEAWAPRCVAGRAAAAGRAARRSRSWCRPTRAGSARWSTGCARTRCGSSRRARRWCWRSAPATDGGVLEVRDGGPGFTDDDLAVAFQRGALQPALPGHPQGRQRARAGPGGAPGRTGSAAPSRPGTRRRVARTVHRPARSLPNPNTCHADPARAERAQAVRHDTYPHGADPHHARPDRPLLGLTACGAGVRRPAAVAADVADEAVRVAGGRLRDRPGRSGAGAVRVRAGRPARTSARPVGTPPASSCARTPCTAR